MTAAENIIPNKGRAGIDVLHRLCNSSGMGVIGYICRWVAPDKNTTVRGLGAGASGLFTIEEYAAIEVVVDNNVSVTGGSGSNNRPKRRGGTAVLTKPEYGNHTRVNGDLCDKTINHLDLDSVPDMAQANTLKTSDIVENYIIQENKKLETLRENIAAIQAEKADLESDNDKLEESIRYMRGLLHNMVSLDNDQKKLQDEINRFLSGLMAILRAVAVLLVGIGGFFLNWALIGVGILLIGLTFRKPETADISASIAETRKANDIIPSLIDRI